MQLQKTNTNVNDSDSGNCFRISHWGEQPKIARCDSRTANANATPMGKGNGKGKGNKMAIKHEKTDN